LNYGFRIACERLVSRAAHALEHHPKHITALVAALLLCGGGGAYAVASFGPDPSLLPVREVIEPVQPLGLKEQADALDVHSLNLFRTEILRSNDTADSLLGRLGVSDPAAAAFLRNDPVFRGQLLGRNSRNVTAETDGNQGLHRLTARWASDDSGQFRRLVVERTPADFTSRIESAPLTVSQRLGSGTIRSSLFAAVDESRIPDEVAIQVADIFSGSIDFNRGLRKGDRFSVVYESLEADGESVRSGRVLSVEFMNNGKLNQAIWFQQPGTKGAYYNFEGKSLSSGYLASPMEFSRVTSGFANRFHPIHKTWRAHLGVDYGAPTGTPVRTVGDGVVEFAGVQNGFGNVVIVRHNPSDVTLYAHLSRFDVRQGQSVTQGQRVGAVGSTGWATGPHLHFEFRINGAHQDPLVVARRAEGTALSAAARPAFDRLAGVLRAQLASAAASPLVASAQ
jgi:murein DD-endopeptidase MepM/ murein hydrolase activator NlpD